MFRSRVAFCEFRRFLKSEEDFNRYRVRTSEATMSRETQTEAALQVSRKEVAATRIGYSEALSYIDQLLSDGQQLKVSLGKRSEELAAREAWIEARSAAVSRERDVLMCQQ